MPYRRLPQTNASRDRALSTCKEKMDATAVANRPFSPALAVELTDGQVDFLKRIDLVNAAKSNQTIQSAVVAPLHKVARFWVNHGYQALINACIRGQFPNGTKSKFGLTLDAMGGPNMDSDSKLSQAATTYIHAETTRRLDGDTPISFPDLADIELHFEAFRVANQDLSTLKLLYDDAQEALAAADSGADLLILRLWNAIEATYDTGNKPSMRRKCREWGLVYVPSKGETPSAEDFSVVGLVKDSETNEPLGNVRVSFLSNDVSDTFHTVEDGMYYMPRVASGNYLLEAYLAGYTAASLPVTIVEGEVQEVNFSLTPIVPPLPAEG
ncbi:MAG: carboxypeptidase-like regulatory domain-containing protein [Flavobacteriales bacterium]|nr:carboxypeptidase-like regulatory domain-containing protein [Flavobacteriales bacterium]